ncbi:MAG TPA: VapC toxin family PIN domain ribonuclease [Prolixibacteraceae bacterium]|nr:VapC toxin family PIN domain ribonuclease [Prolixibacteraceae bacterium]
MSSGLLFDTSVWIDYFSGIDTTQTILLTKHIENDLPIFICPVILQEVLQGVGNDKDYHKIKNSFLELNILSEDPLEAAIGAADIYRKLRKKGLTIRKSNDCLIAWFAIKNSLEIVHNDRDFDMILDNIELLRI